VVIGEADPEVTLTVKIGSRSAPNGQRVSKPNNVNVLGINHDDVGEPYAALDYSKLGVIAIEANPF
jgi:hypothetical protein